MQYCLKGGSLQVWQTGAKVQTSLVGVPHQYYMLRGFISDFARFQFSRKHDSLSYLDILGLCFEAQEYNSS